MHQALCCKSGEVCVPINMDQGGSECEPRFASVPSILEAFEFSIINDLYLLCSTAVETPTATSLSSSFQCRATMGMRGAPRFWWMFFGSDPFRGGGGGGGAGHLHVRSLFKGGRAGGGGGFHHSDPGQIASPSPRTCPMRRQ